MTLQQEEAAVRTPVVTVWPGSHVVTPRCCLPWRVHRGTHRTHPTPSLHSNAVCVFESALNRPLLRHTADAGGVNLYYGAVAGSALVIRGISAV
jgi:hypothetical protein